MPGFWTALTNQPTFNASTALLLTDGRVMCQSSGSKKWWALKPNAFGSYVNGTWSPLADSPNGPLYYASAVLRDGRVIVAGGEYEETQGQVWLNAAEIYDPITNTWTSIATPPGFTQIGDAASCLLPDGRFMLGAPNSSKIAIYDPVTNSWAAAASKTSNEETWVLLYDETILTADCIGHPKSEKYVIAADKWVTAGNVPVDLVKGSDIEIGPGMLLPDGRCLFVGATGATALYTIPNVADQLGTWTIGPTFPIVSGTQLGAEDAPGLSATEREGFAPCRTDYAQFLGSKLVLRVRPGYGLARRGSESAERRRSCLRRQNAAASDGAGIVHRWIHKCSDLHTGSRSEPGLEATDHQRSQPR